MSNEGEQWVRVINRPESHVRCLVETHNKGIIVAYWDEKNYNWKDFKTDKVIRETVVYWKYIQAATEE